MRRPRTSVCTKWVIPGPARRRPALPALPLPGGRLLALDDLVARRRRLGQHDLRLAVLPLADEELALRRAGVIPLQRPEDRVDGVRAQPVGELLLVVDAPHRLDCGLHD